MASTEELGQSAEIERIAEIVTDTLRESGVQVSHVTAMYVAGNVLAATSPACPSCGWVQGHDEGCGR